MKQKYILLILLVFVISKAFTQSNYVVNAIPFQPFSGSLTNLISQDDINSTAINIPFSFDFYGNTYNQLVISTNGYIDFRINNANGFSQWSLLQGQTIPAANFPVKNAILGCFHDMNNSNGQGTITYGVYGTTPYRKFIVYFNNNSHYSCNTVKSSFQMILHETSNIIDVQLIDKQICTTWQAGRAVTGIINDTGMLGIAAPGRNTGTWSAYHEAWRFSRANYYSNYSFVRCDDNADGFQSFNLNVVANDLSPNNPNAVTFYETFVGANVQANPLPTTYFNINADMQTIYANKNGQIIPMILSVIGCGVDADNDSVPTASEDVNNDTNLANDDTDGDGIPNYLDNDDDGDLVLTNLEYVFARPSNSQSVNAILDTDTDGIPNYLDNDDDGDGVLTWREDYNSDGNPANDDTNSNSIPDYLEQAVALGNNTITQTSEFEIYPNPTSNVLHIQNNSGVTMNAINIYSINGSLIKQIKSNEVVTTISVSELQSGIYFVKIEANNQFITKKFIKL